MEISELLKCILVGELGCQASVIFQLQLVISCYTWTLLLRKIWDSLFVNIFT